MGKMAKGCKIKKKRCVCNGKFAKAARCGGKKKVAKGGRKSRKSSRKRSRRRSRR